MTDFDNHDARMEGYQSGYDEGRREGYAQGRAEGYAQGRAAAFAEALLVATSRPITWRRGRRYLRLHEVTMALTNLLLEEGRK